MRRKLVVVRGAVKPSQQSRCKAEASDRYRPDRIGPAESGPAGFGLYNSGSKWRYRGMRNPKRKIAFVLAASDHGTMIVNRFDYRMVSEHDGFGVGFQILEGAAFDAEEVD